VAGVFSLKGTRLETSAASGAVTCEARVSCQPGRRDPCLDWTFASASRLEPDECLVGGVEDDREFAAYLE
jgi:hypothetical protein